MPDEQWTGWETAHHDHDLNYCKRMVSGVTVHARWDTEKLSGVVEVRGGRTLTKSEEFRDEDAFRTAARLVADMAANLHHPNKTGSDAAHELITTLKRRFGVTDEYLMAHTDWSAVIIAGEPAVSSLLARVDELDEAIGPRWWPGTLTRPGEQWVVLSRRS
ncbi:hypothetical protein ACIA8G_27880 [Lentzea sp. NPDC051213]|uniref:hypothetical protein n=1 Tax=Lentzea sp. NPDC051213 TaxID=3364126 RepID=UPI0037A1DD5D